MTVAALPTRGKSTEEIDGPFAVPSRGPLPKAQFELYAPYWLARFSDEGHRILAGRREREYRERRLLERAARASNSSACG